VAAVVTMMTTDTMATTAATMAVLLHRAKLPREF
jgi:hypothetical protein